MTKTIVDVPWTHGIIVLEVRLRGRTEQFTKRLPMLGWARRDEGRLEGVFQDEDGRVVLVTHLFHEALALTPQAQRDDPTLELAAWLAAVEYGGRQFDLSELDDTSCTSLTVLPSQENMHKVRSDCAKARGR